MTDSLEIATVVSGGNRQQKRLPNLNYVTEDIESACAFTLNLEAVARSIKGLSSRQK